MAPLCSSFVRNPDRRDPRSLVADYPTGPVCIEARFANRLLKYRQSAVELMNEMVGVRGFEPPTTCTPCRYATRLRHTPKYRTIA